MLGTTDIAIIIGYFGFALIPGPLGRLAVFYMVQAIACRRLTVIEPASLDWRIFLFTFFATDGAGNR